LNIVGRQGQIIKNLINHRLPKLEKQQVSVLFVAGPSVVFSVFFSSAPRPQAAPHTFMSYRAIFAIAEDGFEKKVITLRILLVPSYGMEWGGGGGGGGGGVFLKRGFPEENRVLFSLGNTFTF